MDIRVCFDDGNYLDTQFNGSLEDAKKYYIGNKFNLGVDRDDMRTCIGLEQLHAGREKLPEYHWLGLTPERLTDSLIDTALERCEFLGITTETARNAVYAYMTHLVVWSEDLEKWGAEMAMAPQEGEHNAPESCEDMLASVELLARECWQLLADDEVTTYRNQNVRLQDVDCAMQAVKVPGCANQMQNLVAELAVLGPDGMRNSQDVQDELSAAGYTINDVQSVFCYMKQH